MNETIRRCALGVLSVFGPMNETELSGFYRMIMHLRPNSDKMFQDGVSCLRYIARVDLGSKFPTKTKIIKPWIDTLLNTLLRKWRANKKIATSNGHWPTSTFFPSL